MPYKWYEEELKPASGETLVPHVVATESRLAELRTEMAALRSSIDAGEDTDGFLAARLRGLTAAAAMLAKGVAKST